MKRTRHQNGGIFIDKRFGIWYYRQTVDGKRQLTRLGTLSELPSKAAAERASLALVGQSTEKKLPGVTFLQVAERYMAEKMPTRHTTAGGYRNYIGHCVERWGDSELVTIASQPMEVWRWVNNLLHS